MTDVLEAVRQTGLLPPGAPVVVLLSGGQDSVCLLDIAGRIGVRARALHVDHGLRADADQDARLCAAVCERLGVPLEVVRPPRPAAGNVQAWGRDVRYAAAARAAAADGALVATGHTASDQVETVLYRLAASPGRRALLGMAARDGALVRPLLGVPREATAAYCEARGLPYATDPTNASDRYARGRVRHGLLPALRAIHPAAERNVLRTLDTLRDEAAVLDAAVDEVLDGDEVSLERLRAAPPALARLALQRLADDAARRLAAGAREVEWRKAAGDAAGARGRAPAVGARLPDVLAAGAGGGTRHVDIGDGLRAEIVYGRVRVVGLPPRTPGGDPAPVTLPIPGRVPFAGGVLTAERGAALPVRDGVLDAAALGEAVTVRAWRPGDRMRPLGLDGSRSLQDIFTDRRVPREARRRLPVLVAGDTVLWIPGVATAETARVTSATRQCVQMEWIPPPAGAPLNYSGPE